MRFGRTSPKVAFRRVGPAAIGSQWTGWSVWLNDSELVLLQELTDSQKTPKSHEAEVLAVDLNERIAEVIA